MPTSGQRIEFNEARDKIMRERVEMAKIMPYLIDKAVDCFTKLYQESYKCSNVSETSALQYKADIYQENFIAIFQGEPGFDKKIFVEKCMRSK